jgi:hypothetical protein
MCPPGTPPNHRSCPRQWTPWTRASQNCIRNSACMVDPPVHRSFRHHHCPPLSSATQHTHARQHDAARPAGVPTRWPTACSGAWRQPAAARSCSLCDTLPGLSKGDTCPMLIALLAAVALPDARSDPRHRSAFLIQASLASNRCTSTTANIQSSRVKTLKVPPGQPGVCICESGCKATG